MLVDKKELDSKFQPIVTLLKKPEVRRSIYEAVMQKPIAPADPKLQATLELIQAIVSYEKSITGKDA